MDEARLWELIQAPGRRELLITLGEARAAVQLLQTLAAADGPEADVAADLAASLARRLPTPQ